MSAPQTQIDEPMRAALDGLVFRAVLSFVGSAAIAAVPLLLRLPPGIHSAAHAVLPSLWLLYALVTWVRLRTSPTPPADPWEQASSVDPDGARTARIAFVALPIGWLMAAAGLLIHHLSTSAGAMEVVGIDVPLLAVTWLLATLAWGASCRALLATACVERERRLRGYLDARRDERANDHS